MAKGSQHQLTLGDATSVVNPDAGSGLLGFDVTNGPYSKIGGTPGGTDGTIIYLGLSTENVQDIVGAFTGSTSTIASTYNDAANTLTFDVVNSSISNSKLANMAASSFKGNNTGGSAAPTDLTVAQAKSLLAIAYADVSGLGTGATKNVGNTVLDPGTGKLELAYPTGGLVTGTNKTYLSTDRGYTFRRSNSGSAMSDTLPALTNTTADIGYWISIYNQDNVVGAQLTMNASGGALFLSATGTTSAISPINYGSRQSFIWDGTQWLLYAGNANLLRRSGTIVAGNFPQFVDTAGNAVVDSGISAAIVNAKVGSVTGADSSITVGGTATAPTLSRAALTGVVTASAGSNVTTIPANQVTLAMLVQSPAHTYLGNNTGSTANAASITSTQLTADLNPATSTLQGLMTASQFNILLHSGSSRVNILDYGGDNTATTDNAAAITAAMAALPATGGVVYFPYGTYNLGTTVTVSKTIIFLGDNAGQSIIQLTSASNDGFTVANWNCGFVSLEITGLATTTTSTRAGGETTIPVGELSNFPASGSVSFGGTAGWVTVTYTGKSAASGAGNLTGCSGVTAAGSGANVMIRTGGYHIQLPAVTSSGGNYNFISNCKMYNCYNGIFFASALGYLDTIELRNVRNNAIVVDGNNDKFINRITTASAPIMNTAMLVNLTSSLLITQSQILQGAIGMDLNPATGITIPSVEVTNTFFDNNTIGMRINATGTGSIYRSKFTNCWFSSATNAGVQFNTVNFDGFSFINCDFYGNGKGIAADIVGGGHWSATGCYFAGNTTAIALSASAAHFPQITQCEIGPRGAFGVNTTGINVGAGTYKGLIIKDNQIVNNTTNATLGAVTVAAGEGSWYKIIDNAGINPLTGAAVTTPAVPASTVTVTNTTGRRVMVLLKAGATAPTVMTVNGVSTVLPLNSQITTLILDPGGTINATYAVAFTWTWVGM